MIPQTRHRAMISDGRYICAGSGSVAGAIRKKADYVVGWAWAPTYTGRDPRFRALAEPIISRWCDVCDVQGGVFDWRMGLRIASMALDRDGDAFAVLTKDPVSGGPRIQWIEAHRIGTPQTAYFGEQKTVPETPETVGYAGMQVRCGVIVDEVSRPVGYNLLEPQKAGEDQPWNIIPAASVVPMMDPEWHTQSRGIPGIVRAVLDWYDVGETREAEKIGTKARSSIAIVEKNETGRRALGKEAIGAGGLPDGGRQGLQTQMMERGLIRYIKSNGDISAFESNRPGQAWQNFMDYLTRGAFLGLDLPYEFAWDSSKIGGANIRAMVSQVQRSVENRQAVLHRPAKSILLYAVASYMARGDIPFTPDWWSWDFSMPAKYSVDVGRDSQNRREDASFGLRAVSEIVEEDGVNFREHIMRRAKDYIEAKRVADEQGVPLEWILNPTASFGNTADIPLTNTVDDEESVSQRQNKQGATQDPQDDEPNQ